MDIQFGGAVDFSPLFNPTNKPGATQPWKNNFNYQENMVQSQNSMLEPLNQQYDFSSYDPASYMDAGQTIDIVA
ncbi:MAG: hypothetical protein V2A34_12695 [Lentisphaerota bacterium]